MTDVLLRSGPDGGEITVEAGLFLMSEGLETAVYLSLFGGNEQDPGASNSREQWWGNLDETIPARIYRSETQYLLRSIPSIPASLRRIEQAAGRDLQWLLDEGIAASLNVETRIPALNRVVIDVSVVTPRQQIQLSFG